MMQYRPFVGIGVLIFKENKILLAKRKFGHGESSWGPPGGHLEFGETLESCAAREVREETVIAIEVPKFLAITNDFFAIEKKHYVSIFMTAKYPDGQQIHNLEPDKNERWEWFDQSHVPDNLFLPLKQLIANQGYGKKLCEVAS